MHGERVHSQVFASGSQPNHFTASHPVVSIVVDAGDTLVESIERDRQAAEKQSFPPASNTGS